MSVTGAIVAAGPLVPCRVHVPRGWSSSGVAQREEAKALVDTGANVSMVDAWLADRLQLPNGGQPLLLQGVQPARAFQAGAPTEVPTKALDLELGGGRWTLMVGVMPLPKALTDAGVRVLLGRNLLDGCRMAWDGPARSFTLDVVEAPRG